MDKHKEIELEHAGKEDTAVNMLVYTQVYIQVYTGTQEARDHPSYLILQVFLLIFHLIDITSLLVQLHRQTNRQYTYRQL